MAKRDKNVKWVNKFSREEGYVKTIHQVEGYFENTFDASAARKYSATEANKAIATLQEIGEADDNELYVVDAVTA